MKFICPILFSILLCSACGNPDKSTNNEWRFDKIAGSKLKFKNGKEFNTNLYDLNYIGQVANEGKAPFLIFSGRDCNECDENINIYIHSPANGHLEVQNGKNRYQYPGSERGIENDSLFYTARAFYGQVLPDVKGVIWYQQQLMDDNSFLASVYLVKLNRGLIRDTGFTDTGELKLTLNFLKQGLCKEIKGLDYKIEP